MLDISIPTQQTEHYLKMTDSFVIIIYVFIFFWFGFQDYFTHFEPSQLLGGSKMGWDPREKPLDHPQAELGSSHMWPQLGSNLQRWEDEQSTVLKITTRPRGLLLSYFCFQFSTGTILVKENVIGLVWVDALYYKHIKCPSLIHKAWITCTQLTEFPRFHKMVRQLLICVLIH